MSVSAGRKEKEQGRNKGMERRQNSLQNKEVLVELAKSLPSRGSSAGRESSSRRPGCEAGPHSDKFHLYEVPKIVQFIESETLLVDTRVCGVRMGVGRGDGELALKGDRVSVEEGEKFGRCIMVRVVQ